MADQSHLKKCNSCGQSFAKSAKECPFCGKNMGSGMLLKLIIGIGILAIIGAFAFPMPKGSMNDLQKIVDATADQVDASELAWILNSRDANTNNPIEPVVNEVKGKIVQWDMEVFVVSRSSDHYKIVTKATHSAPAALLTLYPLNNQQTSYLDNISPGSIIKIKGKIAGSQQGRIKINPAVII